LARLQSGSQGSAGDSLSDEGERSEAERLTASARRRATILESISDAFVALDRDWRYTYVNRRAAELFGRAPEDLVGKHIWTEFPEGVGQPFYYAYQRAMKEGVSVQLEDYYPPWDRWYENRIYPSDDGLSIYFTEITPRKRAEQLLVGQKRVLEMIAGGAALRDTLEALVAVVEEQAAEMFGSILLLDDDGVHLRHGAAPRLPASLNDAIDGASIGASVGSCGTAVFRREPVIVADIETDPLWDDYRHLAAPHGLRACWSTPIFDAERRVLGTFALYFRHAMRPTDHHLRVIDMATHTAAIAIVRKREEERLRASEARYRDLNAELEHRVVERTAELNAKNRELQTFTHSVSHDLKAPLRGIDGYSRLLLEDHAGALNDEGRSFLQNVRTATGQMGRLIDDLLAYSRLERAVVHTGRVELRPLVEELISDRAPEIAARGAVVTMDIPDAIVSADRHALMIALRNLLENALKFTRDTPVPRLEIGARIDVTTCILWVRDNGIGFDMRFHDRIFEVFQRLHRAEDYPGTGVGLAMVRRALQRMGGRVRAESEAGKGATFFLEIPRSE
jgi:PAS domain S-box-containing protein